MIDNQQVEQKIKRHWRRKSKGHMAYVANSYSKDYLIWRCLCALHVQERIEKDNKRYLKIRDMIWLLAMKQFIIESGSDRFFMRDIRRFLNYNLKQAKSAQTSTKVVENLLRAGYVIKAGVTKHGGYMITMKARAFYRDLEDLLQF